MVSVRPGNGTMSITCTTLVSKKPTVDREKKSSINNVSIPDFPYFSETLASGLIPGH